MASKVLRVESFKALLEKDGYGFGNQSAFAKAVGISPGHLHDILTGRRRATEAMIARFRHELRVPEAAIADLVDEAA